MEIIYRRRGVIVEVCKATEYLEEVLKEFDWFCQREKIRNDRMFEAVVASKDSKIKLITGTFRQIFFKFSLKDSKHFRGDEYSLRYDGVLSITEEHKKEDRWERKECSNAGYTACANQLVNISSVYLSRFDVLTADELLQGIRLLEIDKVQSV